MSGYEYDIFISYPRRGQTRSWIERHFKPALEHCLSMELDRHPRVFYDEKLCSGSTWPIQLGRKLSKSRVLVCLWTKNYLHSEWCALELSLMLAREKRFNCRSIEGDSGIIAIPIIHDGQTIPTQLKLIQSFEIKRYFNPRMRINSKKAEELYDVMMENAEDIAYQVENAPAWQPYWSRQFAEEFFEIFWRRNKPSQKNQPTYTEP